MIVRFEFIIVLFVCVSSSLSSKPPFTFDEFFNYTSFSFVTLSPDDTQSVLIQTTHRIWDRNVSEEHLYLYTLRSENRTLITAQASSFKPRWKGDLVALILSKNSSVNQNDDSQYIHLYSIRTGEMFPIPIGQESIHAYTWSPTSMSIYFATRIHWSDEAEEVYKNEWKDVIEYEEQYRGDTIYRVDIENMTVSKIEPLVNISLRVVELMCSPDGKQLVFSTQPKSLIMQTMTDYELYSLDLTNHSSLIPRRLTNNTAIEANLKWSTDGSLFFTVIHSGSVEGAYEDSQGRLYNLNMTSNQIERWATQFNGQVTEYDLLQGGREGVVILGQLSTEVQVYTQLSVSADLIKQNGWNGTYQNIATASSSNSSTIVFIHSSYETPQEVYFIDNINQLTMSHVVTSENKLFTERNLPKGKSYQWVNEDDRTKIEGVLLYPPDKFEQKNLPLFVLIHGGPYNADLNNFRADWYKCGVMMATEGWLVLEPNYRGSTGM
jgi:dipeptidyl aminopeptidase/acylaminoacyl peptidase